ncbi:MAG: hypothetical protein ACK47B_27920 [Armatimonadota bacterium]
MSSVPPRLYPCDSFRLLVECAPDDHTSLQAALTGTFLELGLQGGGLWTLPDGSRVPVVPRPLSELRPRKVHLGAVAADPVPAGSVPASRTFTLLELPPDWARIWSYEAALREGRPRDPGPLLQAVRRSLWEETSRHLEQHLLRTHLAPGFQAQADTDLRLCPGEVGVSRRVLQRLLRHLEVPRVPAPGGSLGYPAVLTRFPVAGPDGSRRVLLRVLPDRPEWKLWTHPAELALLHGGDTDGDLLYVSLLPEASVSLEPLPRTPRLELTAPDSLTLRSLTDLWQPTTREAAIQQVLGARVKDLTGLLTYVFHCLARAAATGERQSRTSPRTIYREVFGLYFPLIEAVMDARKPGGAGPQAVEALARSLQELLQGGPLSRNGFAPFLSEDQLDQLQRLYERSRRMRLTRATAGGCLLGAGGELPRWSARVLSALRARGLPKHALLSALREDLLLTRPLWLPEGTSTLVPPAPVQERQLQLTPPVPEVGSFPELFQAVQYEDRPVFQVLRVEDPAGYPALWLRTLPWWKVRTERCRAYPELRVQLPAVAPAGPRGHYRVHLPGGKKRLFRPVVRLTSDGVRVEGLYQTLLRQVLGVMERFYSGEIWSDGGKLERALNRCLREWVQGEELDDSTPQGDFLGLSEVRLAVPEELELEDRWQVLETLLGWAAEHGYDVSATSRGKPGTLAALANARGEALYGEFLNPFYRYSPTGRRGELRGIREALPLQSPAQALVELRGRPLPPAYHDRVTVVQVALLDTNHSVFPGLQDQESPTLCFDTLLATAAGIERLRVAEECFTVGETQLPRFLQRLRDLGLRDEQLDCRELPHYLGHWEGEPLCETRYELRVRTGSTDTGKVKSLIGPLKGTLTRVPGRVFTLDPVTGAEREVELVWPATSARKKQAVDLGLALAYGKLARAKGTPVELEPETNLEELVQQAEAELAAAGYAPDGTEELWAEVEVPGSEAAGGKQTVRYRLGRALVGPLPVYRPPHTETQSARFLLAPDGVKTEIHSLILAGEDDRPLPFRVDPEAERRCFELLCAIEATERLEREARKPGQPVK